MARVIARAPPTPPVDELSMSSHWNPAQLDQVRLATAGVTWVYITHATAEQYIRLTAKGQCLRCLSLAGVFTPSHMKPGCLNIRKFAWQSWLEQRSPITEH
ncbi:hypothetical protein RBB50_000528 [Rhinocladiella similis]